MYYLNGQFVRKAGKVRRNERSTGEINSIACALLAANVIRLSISVISRSHYGLVVMRGQTTYGGSF